MTLLRSICLILFVCLNAADVAQAALPKGVYELAGTNPTLPETDLKKIDSLARSSEILAIGESAHGSAGYAAFQHRLIQRLVTKFGYRTLLMETVTNDTAVNQYLQNCQGNITNILYHGAWQDDHAQRVALYQWLCAYNQSHPNDRVAVASVDPQKPWLDAPIIRSFLHEISSQVEQEFADPIEAHCFGASDADQLEWAFSPVTSAYFTTGSLPAADYQACVATLDALKSRMIEKRVQWTIKAGAFDYFDAWDAVRSLRAWEVKSQLFFTDTAQALAVREEAFGPSVLWNWRGTGVIPKKAILIAHNVHVTKLPVLASSTDDVWAGLNSVGTQLKQVLGKKYSAISQSGYQVSAMFAGNFPIPTSADSLDVLLHSTQKPYLYVDTKKKAKWLDDKATWFMQEESIPNGRPYDVRNAFDGVVFHDVSPTAVFLGEGVAKAREMSFLNQLY